MTTTAAQLLACPETDCERAFVDTADLDGQALDEHVVTVHGYVDYAVSAAQREAWRKQGLTLPDGSFPIPNVSYLKKAIRAFGRQKAGKTAQVKAWIIRRAKALGATKLLPEGWA